MLKVRIIAGVIAIILTLITIYVVPIIAYHYTNFANGLTKDQRQWFNGIQVVIGFSIAIYGFWRWKKKNKH